MPLFSFTFTPTPGRKKELEIRLPDELGKELLNDLVTEEDYFDSQDKFKEKVPRTGTHGRKQRRMHHRIHGKRFIHGHHSAL